MAEKKQNDEIVDETGTDADASALSEEPTTAETPAEADAAAEAAPEPDAESQSAPEAESQAETAEEPTVEEAPAEEAPAAEAPAEEAPAAEAPAEEPAPAADAEPAADPAAEAGPTPSAPAKPERKKRKRLPRALRPTKGRVKREPSTERKRIVRVPKPQQEFGRRQERQGTVVSDKGDKTIVVKVDTIKAHPRYKKVVRRSKRFHAHDEENAAKLGDVVRIVETRPLSKTKNWRLSEIVEVAK